MTLDVQPTIEDHRRVLRMTLRRTVRIERAVGVVFMVAALPALASDSAGQLSGLFFGAVGLGLVISSFMLPGQLLRRLPAEATAPRTLRIGPEGIGVRTELTVAEVAWPAVRSVTRTPHLWVLRRDRMTPPLVLMRRHFTAEQERELEGYLAGHGRLSGAGSDAARAGGVGAETPVRPAVPGDDAAGSSRR